MVVTLLLFPAASAASSPRPEPALHPASDPARSAASGSARPAALAAPPLDALLEAPEARILWVGAHPDDETLAGPLLARACIARRRPCHLLVLTRGEGGRCPERAGCWPDLGAVRAAEMSAVARAYHASLELHRCWNAPLPESSFPPRPAIAARWRASCDPAGVIAAAIRRFRPTLVLTFDPDRGFTGHPEHQLAARFAFEAVREVAASSAASVYSILNHHWLTRLLGTADPGAPTDEFDAELPCGAPRRSCRDVALAITERHQTQRRDMGLVRALRPQIGPIYARRVEVRAAPAPEAP